MMERIERILYIESILFLMFDTIAFIFGMYGYNMYSMMFLGFALMLVGSIVKSIVYLPKLYGVKYGGNSKSGS